MPSLFSLSIPQLGQWSRRQKVDHRQQNEPVEAINRMMTGVGLPRQKDVPFAPVGSITAQFRLSQSAADFPDHLVCRTWDGETAGEEDVLIAKPYLLRRTPFDDQTYGNVSYNYVSATERQARRDTSRETQVVIPRYILADVIFATSPVQRGTGVIVEEVPVVWLDDNRDGRAWACSVG